MMECAVDDSNKVDVYMSYNAKIQYGNTRLNNLKDKVKLISSSYTDGNIDCTFTREPNTTVGDKIYDLTKDEYYLLIAVGTSLKGKFLEKSGRWRLPVEESVNTA